MRRRKARKLLVASIGVAAVSYGACSGDGTDNDTVANLIAPPEDAGVEASKDGANDAPVTLDVVANLIAPPDGSL